MKTENWHAVEFAGDWIICDEPFYEGKNLLSAEDVGYNEAQAHAKLAAAAPKLLEALTQMVEYYVYAKELTDGELSDMHDSAIEAYNLATSNNN